MLNSSKSINDHYTIEIMAWFNFLKCHQHNIKSRNHHKRNLSACFRKTRGDCWKNCWKTNISCCRGGKAYFCWKNNWSWQTDIHWERNIMPHLYLKTCGSGNRQTHFYWENCWNWQTCLCRENYWGCLFKVS